MANKPLVLIDGSSWLFRAYHGLPPLNTPTGEPTGAVYGMVNMLKRLLKDYAPERIAVVFDPPGPTFRNDIYPEYKANRDETPEDLSRQFPVACEVIRAMGLPVLQVAKVEADDVIGTLTQQAREQGLSVLIVTADKDMAQLVDSGVKLLDTMKNRTMDEAGVVEKFGVPAERITEYLALVGDTSDNIPGVPLVGPKTAAKWLNQYGTLDKIVASAADVPGKAGENLRNSLKTIPLALDLATIRRELELEQTVDQLRPGEPDKVALARLYERLGFKRWLEELGVSSGTPTSAAPAAPMAKGPDSDFASGAKDLAGDPEKSSLAPLVTSPLPAPAVATRAETVLDMATLEQMLARLQKADLICFDTETDSLDSLQARLVGISFAVEAGHGWYIPLQHHYLGVPTQLPMADVIAKLKPLLQDETKPKLGQHIKYDINVLSRHGITVRGVRHDTMLESYVLDAAGWRHDMDSMAQQHLNHKTITFAEVAGKGKSQVTFDQVPVERATEYAAEDADITLRLHQVLHPRLEQIPSLLKVFETLEMPLVPVLARIEQNGVGIDGPLLGRISVELGQRMETFQRQAWEQAGGEFNLASPLQLQQILFEKLKLPVLGKTPKGQPSTAEDVLEELAQPEHGAHPLPRLILDWRGLSKLRSTYADNLPKSINPDTGRIHTSYHQAVAATGRLSSSDPNLQNIPVRTEEGRRIRQAFIAPKGRLLLSIDYSQIELRLMAHLSGDERLQQAFRAGLDIHQATAAEVFGLALDQVGPDQRRAAKAINFGLIYGMSAFGLARQLGVSRTEAQAYMDNFFARYPGVKDFMDRTRVQAHEQGYVETLFGRRLYLRDIKSRNANQRQYAERTAINAPLQGTAADLIKLAMLDVDAFLQENADDVLMIMQVHDELVFEGPVKAIEALANPLAERMCLIHKLSVPLVADWGLGSNWDESHTPKGHARSS